MIKRSRQTRIAASAIAALGFFFLSPVTGSAQEEAQHDGGDDLSPARRWLFPEAADRRVAFDLAGAGIPLRGAWLFGGVDMDLNSGLVVRSSFATHLGGDSRSDQRPRQTFGMAGVGYRWRDRYEIGPAIMFAGGGNEDPLDGERSWSGLTGVMAALGTPEGIRLGMVLGGAVGGGLSPSALGFAYDLQIPVLVLDRVRFFLVNRGFVSSRPSVQANRVELHALIDGRYRPFAGLVTTYGWPGAVAGIGFRFD
jgi:hypothetical protein